MHHIFAISDSHWERVRAVLEAIDPTPPANARALLDALIYQALTGSSWDDLPAVYPSADEVAAAAARWRALGLFAHLEAILLFRLDG